MKTKLYSLLSFLLLLFTACEEKMTETVTYRINEPIVMDAAEFRNSVKVSRVPHELTGYGKISYYNGFLYMSEPGKGIHIINNQNPANPQVVGYIELLGNADLSVRNNILYADSYVDLVWFDVTDPSLPVFKGRLKNAFPDVLPLVDNSAGIDFKMCQEYQSANKIIVGWKEVERTEPVEDYWSNGGFWGWVRNGVFFSAEKNLDFATSSPGGGNSVNGSMSRFIIYQKYLYSVMHNQMQVFDLSGAEPVKAIQDINIGWNVETIFSYQEYMFMGTPTGMLIYSVEDPLKPVFQSSIQHIFGCDPVVVEDDIAYVTIHSGNNCGQTSDALIIYDVKDKKNPKQLVSYAMTHPKGLGIDNKVLFVCDDGLKIFNATDPQKIMASQLAHYKGMAGYDVIPFNKVLMMIAEDGIHQYDYSTLSQIQKISFLPVKAE
jgi:hypothetical protein